MPLSISDALDAQASAADDKISQLRSPARYLLSAALAGAYIGVGVVLLLMVSGPLAAAGSPATKLVQGLVFGVALTLVVFAGAELCTGNMMTMVHGMLVRRRGYLLGFGVIMASFLGNLVGSAVFSWLVFESGVLETHDPGKAAPAAALLVKLVTTKTTLSAGALFFRGVLCNFLVCLAVWMAARTKSDTAKLVLIFWGLLAFIGSGFEHVVANQTVLTLGLLEGHGTVGGFLYNMLWSGLGNLVGGGLLVGAVYGVLGDRSAKSGAVATGEPAGHGTVASNGQATQRPAKV